MSEPLGLLQTHPANLALPAAAGLRTDVVLPADRFIASFADFGFPQNPNDLLGRGSRLPHRRFYFLCPKTISSGMDEFIGARSMTPPARQLEG